MQLSDATIWLGTQSITTYLAIAVVVLLGQSLAHGYRLSHVPGPWYTLFSNYVLLWHEYQCDRTFWVDALHQKYGPIVRLSSSEVHCNSVPALRSLYGIRSPVRKTDWFRTFQYKQMSSMFSELSDSKHAGMRRAVASLYTRSAIVSSTQLSKLRNRAEELVVLLANEPEVELFRVMAYLTLDVISTFVYGERYRARTLTGDVKNRTRLADNTPLKRNWISFMIKGRRLILAQGLTVLGNITDTLRACNDRLRFKSKTQGFGDLNDYVAEACEASSNAADVERQQDDSVLARLVSLNHDPDFILLETRDHVLAGAETTTFVLTYLFYTLATEPEIYSLLRKHILQVGKDEQDQFEILALDACQYLDNVLNEALRLFAPAPFTLPRVATTDIVIENTAIPSGTQIGSQSYSLHRNPAVFEQAHSFIPERWNKPSKEMLDSLWAFGSGSRSCIGKTLAVLEMKIVVARVVEEFSMHVTKLDENGMDPIEEVERLGIAPRDRHMRMQFTKVEQNRQNFV